MTNIAGAVRRPGSAVVDPLIDDPRAPHIEIVPSRIQRKRRPKLAYAAVVVGGVLAIVVTQLMLSIGLSDGAYQISSLQQQQKDLGRTNQALSEQADRLSSPQNLAASAEALGMVANSAPVFLRLSDGAVLGTPSAAAAGTPTVTGGQALVPNALLAPPAVQGTPGTPQTASAPTAPPADPNVPWQGELPSPTTR
jgi:hypothetical protein